MLKYKKQKIIGGSIRMKEFIAVVALIALGLFLYAFTVGPMKGTTETFLESSMNQITAIQPDDYAVK